MLQPVGRAEELEVEHIAQNWWRLRRANKYENATKRVQMREVMLKEFADHANYRDERDREESLLQLQKLIDEIAAVDEAPQDLKERLIAIRLASASMWPMIESGGKELSMINPNFRRLMDEASPEQRSAGLALATIAVATSFLGQECETIRMKLRELAYDRNAIPNSDTLDKLIRYEAASDRNITRALARLERLQRARKNQ